MSKKYIPRFSKNVRIAHWVNVASFMTLVFTGLPLYSETFDFMYYIFGSPANTILIHKCAGVIFILPTIFMLLTDPKSFFYWTKTVLSWGSHDFKYFLEFPKELLGMKSNMPKQDFFNAGQKLNSLVTILCSIIMVASGLVIWFHTSFPVGLVQVAHVLHAVGVGLMVPLIMLHVYLSVGHPASRPSFRGMTKGEVDEEYAKHHHGRWYDEVTNK